MSRMIERMKERNEKIADTAIAGLGLDPTEVRAAAQELPTGEQRVFSPAELKSNRERHLQALSPFVPMHLFNNL